MKKTMIFSQALVILLTLTFIMAAPFTVLAERSTLSKDHGPPQEAIDSCYGKESGDECSFISPYDHEITGICGTVPTASTDLACKPERGRGGHYRAEGPPPYRE